MDNVIIEHTHCKECGAVMYLGKTFPLDENYRMGYDSTQKEYCPLCWTRKAL